MKQKLPISAVLVVHNEEKIIERALVSIKSFVDEIIVVHDGECSDNTLRICKRYGCKTYSRPYIGACEMHRVFSYEHARNNWIIQLDADEVVSVELRNKITTLMKSKNKLEYYQVAWRTILDKKQILQSIKASYLIKEKSII